MATLPGGICMMSCGRNKVESGTVSNPRLCAISVTFKRLRPKKATFLPYCAARSRICWSRCMEELKQEVMILRSDRIE